MFLAGVLLTVIGFGTALVMNLVEAAPEVLFKMPGGMLGWVGLGFAGVVLMVLGRRPGD